MTAELIAEEPEPEPQLDVIARMQLALQDGTNYVISYAAEDIETYGRWGNEAYAYYRVGQIALRSVE